MALVSMVTFDTVENKRAKYTIQTLRSLAKTVDWNKHRLFVIDNGSTDTETQYLLRDLQDGFALDDFGKKLPPATVIFNAENLGTARAVNQGWQHRQPGEHCVKIDNDVEIADAGWLDILDECANRDPELGIVGLKRRDLMEVPYAPEGEWYKSHLYMIPHNPGERWLVLEQVDHVIGTCCLFSSRLLDKIGYLYQPGKYAWDDPDAAVRCHIAGMKSAFYPHVYITHLDVGGDEFCEWKVKQATAMCDAFNQCREAYYTGKQSIYRGPNE